MSLKQNPLLKCLNGNIKPWITCRSSNVEAANTAGQVLIILADIPHCRADAAAAGAVATVAVLLKPASEDEVAASEEIAAILLSKLVLEPDSHAAIAKAGAIPSLVILAHALIASPEPMQVTSVIITSLSFNSENA